MSVHANGLKPFTCLLSVLVLSALVLGSHAEEIPGKVFKDCPECPAMVVIPAGSFDMGGGEEDNEKPLHRVIINHAFAMGQYEVTQGEWRAIMGNNPSGFFRCGDNCPVENVSWNDAQEFVQKLNAKTGKQYRLPTESEWEYACRAGSWQEYCGSDNLDTVGWYDAYSRPAGNSDKHPNAVGQKKANSFGLYDMSGNVFERVEDSYHDNYTGAPTDGSAWQGDGAKRVYRGGAWAYPAEFVRAAFRVGEKPTDRSASTGLRLARMLQ